MKIYGSWIGIEVNETIPMIIPVATIKQVFKHFIVERNRSYLCTGDNCGFCKGGAARRSRYQCTAFIEGMTHQWEFGDDVYRSISTITATAAGMIDITVTRMGDSRRTSYQVSVRVAAPPPRIPADSGRDPDKYLNGRYGHMVQR